MRPIQAERIPSSWLEADSRGKLHSTGARALRGLQASDGAEAGGIYCQIRWLIVTVVQ
jgi:hypothetical protein